MALLIGQVVRGLPASPAAHSLLEQKLDYVQTTSDRFDVLFLGTSHVYREIDPISFDASVASRGPAVNSLNLGVAGMTLWEMRSLVDALERRGMLGARVVVLEALYVDVNPDNWANDRTMAVQDTGTTREIIQYAFTLPARTPLDYFARFQIAGSQGLSFVGRRVNLGQLAPRLFPDTQRYLPSGDLEVDMQGRRGFLPIEDETDAKYKSRHATFLNQQTTWAQQLAQPATSSTDPDKLPGVYTAAMRRVLDKIRAAGAEPVILLSPQLDQDQLAAAFREHGQTAFPNVTILDYSSSHGASSLYDLRYWFDQGHLNTEGAALFTNVLAKDLLQPPGQRQSEWKLAWAMRPLTNPNHSATWMGIPDAAH